MLEYMQFIGEYSQLWLILHLFAMVLGLGGATYSDILLVHFLSDLKISKKEADVIHTMSQVILVGIILAAVSGLFLFLPNTEELLQAPKFLIKVTIFAILTINGFLLHRIVLPKLIHFSFHKNHYIVKEALHLRHLGFTMGAISFVSWYSVFLLGALETIPGTFTQLLAIYLIILIFAILIALIVERYISKTLD